MANTLKTIVSKKKHRYVKEGFNLDLSYITDRIIAMGFPAENFEAIYRNSMDEVKRFLDEKHMNHYKIYNLCSEPVRVYDKNKFHGRVACYPFDDHHPPNYSVLQPFCEDVDSWLKENEQNVAVVHCKAGKGRTGVMICCYLLHSMMYTTDEHSSTHTTAEKVLQFYGRQRTMDNKGVTIPSQRRYITYYDTMLRQNLHYEPVKLYLRYLVLDPVPAFSNVGNDCYLQFEVKQRRHPPYESRWYAIKKNERQVSLQIEPPLLLEEDVKIEFSTKPRLDTLLGGIAIKAKFPKSEKVFHFWLNSYFVDKQLEGGLAHDHASHHLHHASGGSSEDSDFEVLKSNKNGTSVSFADNDSANIRQTSLLEAGLASKDVDLSNLMKHASISDDHLLQDRQKNPHLYHSQSHVLHQRLKVVNDDLSLTLEESESSTTLDTFSQNRLRHSSVPQTAKATGAMSHVSHVVAANHATVQANNHRDNAVAASEVVSVKIPGQNLSLRLTKAQIDKAAKDKQAKVFPDNFTVTLFLVKPHDQSVDYRQPQQPQQQPQLQRGSTVIAGNSHQFTVVPVTTSASSTDCSTRERVRPLTGGSGASSSSATPSIKSNEDGHSSPEQSSSEEDLRNQFNKTTTVADNNGVVKRNKFKLAQPPNTKSSSTATAVKSRSEKASNNSLVDNVNHVATWI